MNNIDHIVLSCEHAGNKLPVGFRHLFAEKKSILNTHRALDIGILPLAKRLAKLLHRPLFACYTTRLLIDSNRSLGHPDLFSEFSRGLSSADKNWLVHNLHRRYREPVIAHIRRQIRRNRSVLHLSLHSFTPMLRGRTRTADIGILYDPARIRERALAQRLQDILRHGTDLRIRRNYPYRGNANGLTTALRKTWNARLYMGIEIEFNQVLLMESRFRPGQMASLLCRSLQRLLKSSGEDPRY